MRKTESEIPAHDKLAVKEIKARLRLKKIQLSIHAITHGKPQDGSLFEAYKEHDLRTRESYWGSVDDGLPSNLIKTMDDETFFALESEKEELILKEKKPATLSWRSPSSSRTGGALWEKLDNRFPDIRGVERSAAPVTGIYEGRIKTPIYSFSGLNEHENAILSRITIIFGLNAHRDLWQAEYIAKILYKFTHNKDAASLGHIGGKNHVCLPYILENLFDLEVEVIHDQYGGPNNLLKKLLKIIPPEIVLGVFTKYPQANEGGAFGWDGKKIVELLSPHINEIKPLILENYRIEKDGSLIEL